MAIALSLQRYLDGRGCSYDVVPHERTLHATDTADVSDVPKDNLAKGVLMKRRRLPSCSRSSILPRRSRRRCEFHPAARRSGNRG